MSRFTRVLVATCAALTVVGTVGDVVAAAPPAPSAPAPQVYVVRAGDYLSGIAVKLGVKLKDLLTVNSLTLNSVILPGQQLTVPAGGSLPAVTPTPSGAPQAYVVRPGDSLYGIARSLQVTLGDLLRLNQLNVTSLIYPGMKLTLPGGAASPGSAPSAPVAAAPTAPSAATTPGPAQVYVVVAGDSLYGIALKLKVSLSTLLTANSLQATSMIHPGTRLTVPAGGVLPSTSVTPATPAAVAATPNSATGNSRIAPVLSFALAQQGKPYAFNTAGPDSYDCSGLTMAAYAEIGISLPHYSGSQVRYGNAVDWTTDPIQPGDLVFLESSPGSGVINHVGIATSATQWVQAPRTGETVRVGAIPMYRVVAVRRLVTA